jgi:Zn-dependent protease
VTYTTRMLPTRNGSVRFFRFRGIDVFVHWSWFLVAFYFIYERHASRVSLAWNALEYLSLFVIILMHEFGHSLACRQVGGQSDQIILWPLGGVAFVDPPPRPGATLWSIAAGPLVNVALLPILTFFYYRSGYWHLPPVLSELPNFFYDLWMINIVILCFNLLPVYPLDGGQILRSLLWYLIGRRKSLAVSAIIGTVGVVALIVYALYSTNLWMGVVAIFVLSNCWQGWKESQLLKQMETIPRHEHYTCPSCRAHPMRAPLWICGGCQTRFDTFETKGTCPKCFMTFNKTRCPECGAHNLIQDWGVIKATPPPPPISV